MNMLGATRLLITLAAVSASSLGAKPQQPDNAPDTDAVIAQAQSRLLARLSDPDSATFSWPYGFRWFRDKPMALLPGRSGWVTCGYMRARNRMGGFSPELAVKIWVKRGEIHDVAVDDDAGDFPVIRMECNNLIAGGMPLR